MTLKVVTANRLWDGLVVYLAADGSWSERLAEGSVAADEAVQAELEARARAAAAAHLVVAPYLIEVRHEGGAVRPVQYREEIRARGPTVRPDLGKQALAGA